MRFPGCWLGHVKSVPNVPELCVFVRELQVFSPSHSVTAASTQKMNPVSAVWVGKKKTIAIPEQV